MSLIISKFGMMQGGTVDTWTLPSNCKHGYYMEDNANDSVGSQNGTPTSITYTAGKVGNCGIFDGSSSKIVVGSPSDFNRVAKTSVGCAYEAWVYVTSWGSGEKDIIQESDGWAAAIATNGTGVIEGLKYTGSVYSVQATGLSLNTWYHCVLNIYSDYSIEFFVNGISKGTDSNTTIPVNETGGIVIGNHYSLSRYFTGRVDQVRFYLGPLTPQEITALYNSGNGR